MSARASAPPGKSARSSGRRAPKAGALLIGADYRALGVARSLGRRGIPVEVLAHGDDLLATHSRYVRCSRTFPETHDEARVAFLVELARQGLAGWTIFPSGDETAALVAQHHDRLAEWFLLTTPRWRIFRWAYDKRLTYRLAETLGVAAPLTWYPGKAELPQLGVRFPAILKPAVKTSLNRLTAAKAWRVDSLGELEERFAEASTLVPRDEIMIQELVPGDGEQQLSYAALCADGCALADIVARRTRQYPPEFGRASTFVESIAAPEIAEVGRRLLAAMRFDGLVEVEFKRHPDGRLLVLDVNPRVWGWHTLAIAAGVDFPFLAWERVHGRRIRFLTAQPGRRWVRLSTDVPTSVREILHRRLSARSYLLSLLGGVEGAIFARDDPAPALLELPLLVRTLLRRILRGSPV